MSSSDSDSQQRSSDDEQPPHYDVIMRRMSKSALDLSQTSHDPALDRPANIRGISVEPQHLYADDDETASSTVRPSSRHDDRSAQQHHLADKVVLVQKTHSFFHTLRSRFQRSNSRDPTSPLSKFESSDAQKLAKSLYDVSMKDGNSSTDYGFDSSEQSSSITPNTKSPKKWSKHLLANKFHNGASEQETEHFAALRKHEFFVLDIYLKHGRNLPAMDSSGTSDPYVKFKLAGKIVCKSKIIYKSLNPLWDETFQIPFEDPFQQLQIKVYDHDWGRNDDFIGETELDISSLEIEKEQELTLCLSDPSKPGDKGTLSIKTTLSPKPKEMKDQLMNTSKSADVKKLKNQLWNSVVTVVLVEARDLMAMDAEGTSDPYVKCRLGSEKYKSKVIDRTLCPRWLEQFDMHLYDMGSQIFEMEVFDHDARSKDDFMGKCVVDVSKLETEKTHDLWTELEDGAGSLHILLTISGVTNVETVSDLLTYREDEEQTKLVEKQYGLRETFKQVKDIGQLTVKVFKAQGLTSADIGGKSDPFCVLELVNARLQTQTEYKTLSPQWNKIFTFNVKDIHSILEVTVYDEDRDHKVEFLGKVEIPLLKVRSGERRWYALKNKKMIGRAKGNNAQIMLEMSLVWNVIRAGIRSLNPREEKYTRNEVKFKRAIFIRNVNRLKVMGASMAEGAKFLKSIFDWESKPRTIIAFFVFMIGVYSFELYMAPVGLLIAFFKGWIVNLVTSGFRQNDDDDYPADDDDDDDDKDKTKKKDVQEFAYTWATQFPIVFVLLIIVDEKKTLKEKLMAVQEVTAMVQNIMGYVASLGECVQNTFNFTVPFVSWVAVVLLCVGALILYTVPIRYLIMIWGCHKFSKKLLRPNAIPNNELLDLLSRVPDNDQLRQYRELRPVGGSEADRRREQRQKQSQRKTN